jgi:hypothetical protein
MLLLCDLGRRQGPQWLDVVDWLSVEFDGKPNKVGILAQYLSAQLK